MKIYIVMLIEGEIDYFRCIYKYVIYLHPSLQLNKLIYIHICNVYCLLKQTYFEARGIINTFAR